MYKGKKTILEDNKIQVDLMKGDEIVRTQIVESDNYANAIIIPWVATSGYTDMTVNSNNYEVDWDNFESIYLYQD
jgi:hypothetical protein